MALIPCPDCGRQISTLAHSCPHCGASNGQNSYAINSSRRARRDSTVQHRHPHIRLSKKKMWIIVLSCAAALIVLGGGGWLIHHNRQLAAQEQARYDALMDNFSIADAQTFLLYYPDTEHLKEIQDNIALFQRYEQEWIKIAGSTNADDFAMFRSKYPNSPFDQRAYDKIDSLDWTYAKRSDTEGALQKYLDMHPDGKYAEQARQQLQHIIDTRVSADERAYITRIVNAYFAALTDRNKEALTGITTNDVFIKSCDFIDGHEGAGGAKYAIVSSVSIEKKPTDDGATYAAICTVSRTTAATEGDSGINEVVVQTIFNTHMQISAVNMRVKQ